VLGVRRTFLGSFEGLDIYSLATSPSYKAIRYTLPTGIIEALNEAIEQRYRDSRSQSFTLIEIIASPPIVGFE
jgi:hypothetical protein